MSKSKISFNLLTICGIAVGVLGILSAVLFMVAPIVATLSQTILSVEITASISVPGILAIFGGTGEVTTVSGSTTVVSTVNDMKFNFMGLLVIILLVLGAIAIVVGAIKKSKLLICVAVLLLLVGAILSFIEPTFFINANNGENEIAQEFKDLFKLSPLGITASVIALISTLGAGAEMYLVLKK
ncbi:MAG: hypothetical protein LBM03_01405 [Erysipelotrichaceae bacterium]|jgi:hypothetical protein|nr:hypothetical protein [Erysipelotrichaceae bacterium]